jgi:hypothetical protein
MTGLFGCWIRRTAGIAGVVVAVALIAAPGALASGGTTITGAAGVQFNGVIDNAAQCSDATSITINWGDGTATSNGSYNSLSEVVGTHTYASARAYSGTITFTGGTSGSCTGSTSPDAFTANIGATPQFTECPQVGVDVGCQFLIDVTANGTTILQDTSQGPYEGSEDALIGVKNDSSSPLSSIPISTPANSGTFSFDGDGLCDNGAGPVPAGCVQIGTANTPCDPTNFMPCAFPPAPGQPAADPDAYTGSTQNGYEGPQNYYTNVSSDLSSGTVVFSPAIPPGGSTYFSLEEPPSASAINVGATPIGGGLSGAPTVTATTASFVAIVDPNGSLTTAQFQFSLDPRYGSLADFAQTTPQQTVGGDFANHVVTATVTGLVPNALYHVHLVANNKNGQTVGPDVTFKTAAGPAPGTPTLGKSFNISPVSGLILVKIHGVFIPLTEITQIPKNTVIDALKGTLKLITAGGSHPAADVAAKKGKGKGKTTTQSGTFGGAIFKISQATGGANKGLATLTIVENAFKGAPSYSECTKKAADATAAKASSKTLQLLKSSAKGKFSTKGKYSAATVLGTKWTVADRCDGTFTHDQTDSVKVTDFVHHKTIILHAGQSYLAKKP